MTRVVFFDAGNTLIHPFPSVGEIYADVARKHGMRIDPEGVSRAFAEVLARHDVKSLSNAGTEKAWWKRIVMETITQLCEPRGEPREFDGFFETLWIHFTTKEAWRIYPDVLPVLEVLESQGYTLGVISNWDTRLPTVLDNLGLSRFFPVQAISSLVGSSKPEPSIFLYALEQAGCTAQHALHIGDSIELDHGGASACGIRSLVIDRDRPPPENAKHRTIGSLFELFEYL